MMGRGRPIGLGNWGGEEAIVVAVLFHTGAVAFPQEFAVPHITRHGHPMPVDEMAFDSPDLDIILAHMGGSYFYEALVIAEKHPRICLDTATCPSSASGCSPTSRPAR